MEEWGVWGQDFRYVAIVPNGQVQIMTPGVGGAYREGKVHRQEAGISVVTVIKKMTGGGVDGKTVSQELCPSLKHQANV